MLKLILASSSPYRQQLLSRLGVSFDCVSPEIDEQHLKDESPDDYVLRLSREKAAKIGEIREKSLIIGSDQCAVCDQQIIGKPGSHAVALQQLSQLSGKQVDFITGVTVFNTQSGAMSTWADRYTIKFRTLQSDEIERYLRADEPYHCAASFKSESLGIALCESMQGDDPTALIGLPLIQVAQQLRQFGLVIP